MSRLTPTCCAVLLVLTAASPQAAAQSPSPHTSQMLLGNAHVSALEGNKVVVTLEAKGDLRGMFTLTLSTAGNQVTGGEWAFVVRYTEYLDAEGNVIAEESLAAESHAVESQGTESHEHEHGESAPHHERPRFVDRGTLAGSVIGGQLSLDESGRVAGVDLALLTLDSGSLTLTGASGTGTAQVLDVQNTATSSGALSLTF